MKFVHAADIHLDSPLRGLERYEGAPVAEIRGATRRALENLVDLCLDETAAFLVIAGDVYDGDWKDHNTGLFFTAQMRRLREAEIPVILIRGNHDAASLITRGLTLPENVIELRHDRPDSRELPGLGVVVHGQSFATRDMRDDLSAAYPQPFEGLVNIGLLHTCAGGREGHESYAPCSIDALAAHGYDYWALGHVHQREELRSDPWILFPGNLQGRHARETGAKGASVVTIVDGRLERPVHRDLDVVRWAVSKIDVAEATGLHDVVGRAGEAVRDQVGLAGERPLALRIQIVGQSPVHRELASGRERLLAEIRQVVTDESGESAWLEKLELRTTAPGNALPDDGGVAASILGYVTAARKDAEAAAALHSTLDELLRKLPAELRAELGDPATLATLAAEAGELLSDRLLAVDGDA